MDIDFPTPLISDRKCRWCKAIKAHFLRGIGHQNEPGKEVYLRWTCVACRSDDYPTYAENRTEKLEA